MRNNEADPQAGSIASTATVDDPGDLDKTRVWLVPEYGLEHGPTCGTRIQSPHDICQARFSPYNAGERFVVGRTEPVVRCVVCGSWWREVAG